MAEWFRFGVSLLVILVCNGLAYAPRTETIERDLNKALVQYKAKIEDLSRSRGLEKLAVIKPATDGDDGYLLNGARPIAHSNNISLEDLSNVLKNYPDSTAILFYSYLGNSLRVWLIDRDGVKAFHEAETSRSDLTAAMTNLRRPLRDDVLQFDRAPRLRSSRRTVRRGMAVMPLRQSLKVLTSILLPRAITQDLMSVRHLMIAPVMGIGTVPFAMLQPYGDRTCLIDKMSVSVVPSVYAHRWRTIAQTCSRHHHSTAETRP